MLTFNSFWLICLIFKYSVGQMAELMPIDCYNYDIMKIY